MNNYDFTSKDFALSAEGVHLLRSNGFNYKTISFYDVQKATFKRAPDPNNVWLMLIAGVVLILLAIFQTLDIYWKINDSSIHHIYRESIAAIVLLFLTGI